MSIKKELLDELTEKQLKELAKSKGAKFTMSDAQKKYYLSFFYYRYLITILFYRTSTAER